MTPLERAARALCQLSDRSSNAPGSSGSVVADGERGWEAFVPQARAVLEAVREPSEAMIEAGAEIVRNVHVEESEEAFASDAANTWRFMIDAALGSD